MQKILTKVLFRTLIALDKIRVIELRVVIVASINNSFALEMTTSAQNLLNLISHEDQYFDWD